MNSKNSPIYFLMATVALVIFTVNFARSHVEIMEFEAVDHVEQPHVKTVFKPIAVKPFHDDLEGRRFNSAAQLEWISEGED